MGPNGTYSTGETSYADGMTELEQYFLTTNEDALSWSWTKACKTKRRRDSVWTSGDFCSCVHTRWSQYTTWHVPSEICRRLWDRTYTRALGAHPEARRESTLAMGQDGKRWCKDSLALNWTTVPNPSLHWQVQTSTDKKAQEEGSRTRPKAQKLRQRQNLNFGLRMLPYWTWFGQPVDRKASQSRKKHDRQTQRWLCEPQTSRWYTNLCAGETVV